MGNRSCSHRMSGRGLGAGAGLGFGEGFGLRPLSPPGNIGGRPGGVLTAGCFVLRAWPKRSSVGSDGLLRYSGRLFGEARSTIFDLILDAGVALNVTSDNMLLA
jgi:hypothetical protein